MHGFIKIIKQFLFINNVNINIEELKQQLLQDQEFMQQLKEKVGIEETGENIQEENNSELDMDEDMMLAGLSMLETDFGKE